MAVLDESDVYIWYRSTTLLDSDAVNLADRNLSIEERTRRDRFRLEADRLDFTLAHDLLRRALSRYADVRPNDWRFITNHYGKSSIESIDPKVPALSFSLSHTRGCVACAITSSAPLGVDVERSDQSPHTQEIANRYFSRKEATWLRQCPDELRNIRFAELWTLKEAYLKAIGVGLSGSLTDVSFRFDARPRIEFSGSSNIDAHEWHFALFEPVNNVRLGIVIRSVAQPRFYMRQDVGNGPTLTPIRMSSSSLNEG